MGLDLREDAGTDRHHRELTARCDDRGAGVFGTAFGFLVFIIFLLFAVQLLFGLYARTTITAVASDFARIAATSGDELGSAAFSELEAEARARLGRYGDTADFRFAVVDATGDGVADTVTVTVTAELPTLLPARWTPGVPDQVSRTMRARIETVQGMVDEDDDQGGG